jgi:hypothetical protein
VSPRQSATTLRRLLRLLIITAGGDGHPVFHSIMGGLTTAAITGIVLTTIITAGIAGND